MKRGVLASLGVAAFAFIAFACGKESKIDMNFADKYEGKRVELISFADSTILASAMIENGKASFVTAESDSVHFPLLAQIVIDGRVRAYHVVENGNSVLTDSMSVSSGTESNNQFSRIMATMDSIENLDDMKVYAEYAERFYNENKQSPFGGYFAVEWLKYAEPQRVDSFLNLLPKELRQSQRVKHYEKFARHRAKTAPGMVYTDFEGENVKGGKVKLSDFIKPGRYTMIDFWASWCPYCIKELPEMKEIYAKYHDKGFDIVGVAVRDKTADTQNMVKKRDLTWGIMYNTQKLPYDIYGFSGIPHHILVGPDGKIISRGETMPQIEARLESLLK